MKVLLVNGSPHARGCTYTALCEVEKELNAAGIETEIFQLGNEPVRGCTACGRCRKIGEGCVFNDVVKTALKKAETADGFVFGSPVYYASANGSM